MTTDPDRSAITEVIDNLYRAISFTGEDGPDFDLLTTLFAPGARMIEVAPEGTRIIDLETFITRAINELESGRITRFHESELCHRIDCFGHMAQVLSTYEARDLPDDDAPIARGLNSIQLCKDDKGWLVVSIMWQNETADDQIPPVYLPEQ